MKRTSQKVRSSLTGSRSNNPIFYTARRIFVPSRGDPGIVNFGRIILITIIVILLFSCVTSVGATGYNEVPTTSKRGASMLTFLAIALAVTGFGVALWAAISWRRGKMDKGTTVGLVVGGLVLMVIGVVIAILAGNEASESQSTVLMFVLLGITLPLSQTRGRRLNLRMVFVILLLIAIVLPAFGLYQHAMTKSEKEAGGFEVKETTGIIAITATPNVNGCKYDAFIGTELLQSRQDPKKCSLNAASAFWVTIKEAARKKLQDLKRTDVDQLLKNFAEGFKNPKFTVP